MGFLGVGVGESQIMVGAGLLRVQGQVELVLPAEFKPGLGQGVVPPLGGGMALRQVSRMGRQLVGDHTFPHVLPVRQAQVFLAQPRWPMIAPPMAPVIWS